MSAHGWYRQWNLWVSTTASDFEEEVDKRLRTLCRRKKLRKVSVCFLIWRDLMWLDRMETPQWDHVCHECNIPPLGCQDCGVLFEQWPPQDARESKWMCDTCRDAW